MLSRREFVKLLLQGLLAGDLLSLVVPRIKPAIAAGEIRKVPVIMVEAGSCTGDSVSLLHVWTPNWRYIMSNIFDWRYDALLMQVSGEKAYQALMETYEKEAYQYILIVQGSMVYRDGGAYNYVIHDGSRLLTGLELVRLLGLKAKYVVAIGTCATHGGPPAGAPNPSQSTGTEKLLHERRVINVPGCPAHPDWMVGTLLHLALYGEPELDRFNRPKLFYGETIHDRCDRRTSFDQGIFATDIGQKECLYRVGCKGPVTFADCPIRHWNDFINWPIGCNSPCIGCTEPGFPDSMSPFTSHLPDISFPGGAKVTTDTVGLGVLGATSALIAGHVIASFYKGRMQKHLLQSTLKINYRPLLKKNKVPRTYRLKSYHPRP